MLHTADREMSEEEIVSRLGHFSRLGGAKVEIPKLGHLKSLAPFGLTPWVFRLATAPDKTNNTVALVRSSLMSPFLHHHGTLSRHFCVGRGAYSRSISSLSLDGSHRIHARSVRRT